MKYVVIVGDGMGDYPLKELSGKTPLQAADKPNIDAIAERGRSGLLQTVPAKYEPGSDVANLSILGYDPEVYHPGGRGPIEAAAQGIKLKPGDLAFRANVITVKDGMIKDYSAGKISNSDAAALIAEADKHFGSRGAEFRPGISYRNLFILRGSDLEPDDFKCFPPHDHPGEPYKDFLIQGRGKAKPLAEKMNRWMLDSIDVFAKNPAGRRLKTQDTGLKDMLWIWGPGKLRREFPTLKQRFGWEGVMISAVDLLKGLGVLAGLKVVEVPGANAYFDTNFEGKADAAVKALEKDDFAFIHVEAPDEAGHEGLLEEKVKAIENIDKRVVARIVGKLDARYGDDYKLGFLCDHWTPVKLRTHVRDPVPFCIMGGGSDGVKKYDEESAKKGSFGLRNGHEFMELMARGSFGPCAQLAYAQSTRQVRAKK
jgi:2,3-bisphosphoglycerate-independent phosphoglycerate mutase